MIFAVVVERTGPESYCAYSPDVPGCISVDDSPEEALAGYQEALIYHLMSIREGGGQIPLPTTVVGTVEVEVPDVA